MLRSARRRSRPVGGLASARPGGWRNRLPQRAVGANVEQQAPNNSFSPPLYYVDKPFRCVDCGKEEVWTANQQKWYYEVAKGSIYGQGIDVAPAEEKGDELNSLRRLCNGCCTVGDVVQGTRGLGNPVGFQDISRRLRPKADTAGTESAIPVTLERCQSFSESIPCHRPISASIIISSSAPRAAFLQLIHLGDPTSTPIWAARFAVWGVFLKRSVVSPIMFISLSV